MELGDSFPESPDSMGDSALESLRLDFFHEISLEEAELDGLASNPVLETEGSGNPLAARIEAPISNPSSTNRKLTRRDEDRLLASPSRRRQASVSASTVFLPHEFNISRVPSHGFSRISSAAEPISQHLRSVMPYVLLFTQLPYDFLERKIAHHRRMLVKQSVSVMFHHSLPLSTLLHRPAIALLFILLAALQFFFAAQALRRKQTDFVSTAFRFTPLQLRSGAEQIAEPHVDRLHLYQETFRHDDPGCLGEVVPDSVEADGKHLLLLFEEPQRVDGFTVQSRGPAEEHPVRFVVSREREGEWETIGYHRDHVLFSGERRAAGAAEMRGGALSNDLRRSRDWRWYVGRVGGSTAMGAGMVTAGVTGLLGLAVAVARPALYGCWGLASGLMAVAAVSYLADGQLEEGLMWCVYAGVVGAATAGLWWREAWLLHVLPSLGLALIAADAASTAAVVGEWEVSANHAVLGGCMVVGGAVLWGVSVLQHRFVSSAVAADRQVYEQAWRAVVEAEGGEAALRALGRVAADTGAAQVGAAQQCQRILVQRGVGMGVDGEEEEDIGLRWVWWVRNAWSTLLFDMPLETVRMKPLRSLDQLVAQAVCLDPILRGKVEEWALASGGMFATQAGSYLRWAARTDEEVAWAGIKKERRAIEKVIRCYGEDVSRLVDVCRQTIVFATVGELADCLQRIASDEAVQVVRVKNRMSLRDDAAWSAGFRNVSVNLRIKGEDAQSFGVDSHVCELQLLLHSFAELQRGEGRRGRYRLFRDHGRPVQRRSPAWVRWLLDRAVLAWKAPPEALQPRPSASSAPPEPPASQPRSVGGAGAGEGQGWLRLRSLSAASDASQASQHAPPPIEASQRSLSLSQSSNSLVPALMRLSSKSLDGPSLEQLPSLSQNAEGTPVEDEVLRAFRQLIFRCNTSQKRKRGRVLDFWAAMETVSASSVFFIRHPVQGALTKRVWRMALLVIAAAGLAFSLCHAYELATRIHSFPLFRFTARGTRSDPSPATPLTNLSLADFGVSLLTCASITVVEGREWAGASLTVRYTEAVAMDGCWLRTAHAAPDHDPVRYVVEGSQDGQRWTRVCGSAFVEDMWTGIWWDDGPNWGMTVEREALSDERVWTTPRILGRLSMMVSGFSFAALAVAAVRAGFGYLGNLRLIAGGMVASFVALLGLGLWVAPIFWDQAQATLGAAGIFGILAAAVICRQRAIFAAGAAAMLFGLGIQYLQSRSFPWFIPFVSYLELAILCVCVLVGCIRLHILVASRRMVAVDTRQYDALWEAVAEEERGALERLEVLAAPQPEHDPVPRHYSSRLLCGLRPRPVRDVDQIYAQAMCLYPILLGKVQEWALASGGLFPTHKGSYLRWKEVVEAGDGWKQIAWAGIKKEGRAIEKVIRCYGEDVSRLVDVCRQTIVFATVGELADCLQRIASDEAVQVVRVKNRMSLRDDAAWSAGFRNVSVNLRIKGEDAQSFGVDSHVCELQLLLHSFAKLQKAQGHKRYVQFRNVRGE